MRRVILFFIESYPLRIIRRVLVGIAYFAIVFVVLSTANTRFETFVLAILVQLYAAVLYNFSLIGVASDLNNFAAFARFRILALAQGVEGDENGSYVDQENDLAAIIDRHRVIIRITRISHFIVSIYALYKIVSTALFS
jgi:hypothetical protein